jgi:hypothetical protein
MRVRGWREDRRGREDRGSESLLRSELALNKGVVGREE